MIERIQDLPEGIIGLRAKGRISREDYETIVEPALAEARSSGRRIRLLYHFAPEFEGFTPGAAWDDTQMGLRFLRLFERCAIVSDKEWIRGVARGVGVLLPCPVKVFGEAEVQDAITWLGLPVASVHVEHRLLPEKGVLLVEPKGKLTVEDFDAIALTVDPWIESGRPLNGLVVHIEKFPGWETFGSFLRHVQFVRDHHQQIGRVALSADGSMAKLAPAIAEAFVKAEVQHFGFDELERAIDWASRERAPRAEGAAQPTQSAQPSERTEGGPPSG